MSAQFRNLHQYAAQRIIRLVIQQLVSWLLNILVLYVLYIFCKEMNTFIHQGCMKFIIFITISNLFQILDLFCIFALI